MMEIIKRGKIMGDKTARFECRDCKSVLEAKAKEGKYINDYRDGDFYSFKCPVCNGSIAVDTNRFK